jgi:uncharacterized iron-regulated membrane protein
MDIGIGEVERLLPRVDVAHWGGGVNIFYPDGPRDVFTIMHITDKAEGQRSIYIDPGTGDVLRVVNWSDYSPGAKAIEWGVMVHLGREFGLANQIFNLVICLAIIGFAVSGLAMWWTRRPNGEIGAPAKHEDGDRLPWPIMATTLVVAVVFPLVGASLLVVWLFSVATRPMRLKS